MANDPLTIRPSAELRAVLERAALDQERPLSGVACRALQEWAERLEAATAAKAEAEQRAAADKRRYADLRAKYGLPETTPPA
jgi:hypothetical protein